MNLQILQIRTEEKKVNFSKYLNILSTVCLVSDKYSNYSLDLNINVVIM